MMIFVSLLLGRSIASEPPRKRLRLDEPTEVYVSQGLTVAGISSNDRLIENYNFTEISRVYGSGFASVLQRVTQADEHEDAFTPLRNNETSERARFGSFLLGRKISSSEQSVLYEIQGRPDLLIKYQANCMELMPSVRVSETHYVHPLVVDFLFAQKAAIIGIGPRVHYLSPPGPLCEYQEGKCDFKMREDDFEDCSDLDGSSLRFMIMDRVGGQNLWEYKKKFKDGIVPLASSLTIAIAMMTSLQRLHVTGRMVHGDLHINNVMLEYFDEKNDTIALKFIDYGRAFSNRQRNNETIRKRGWAHDSQFSSWELEGYDPAARDDVERAVQVIAQLMMPWSYVKAEKMISNHGVLSILKWKRRGYWFVEPQLRDDPKPAYDPVQALGIPERTRQIIRQNFRLILQIVRGVNDVNSPPSYKDLIFGFTATRALIFDELDLTATSNTTILPN